MTRGPSAFASWARGLAWVAPLLLFVGLHGTAVLHPRSIDWVLSGDSAAHFVGWQSYRAAPLAWPLGWIPGYTWPLGTSIGQTDSIPLVALALKPIAHTLPAESQYFGAWLLACWVLQGALAFRLLRTDDRRRDVAALFASLLFATAPALVQRELMHHEALSAHAFIISAFLLYRADWRTRRTPALTVALLGAASLVHPYFVIMIAAITCAAIVRAGVDQGRGAAGRAAIGLAAGLAAAGAGIWAAGYLGGGADQGASGFGECAADTFTFVNPMSFSTFLRGFPVLPCRHEGFAYLGMGITALIIAALVALRSGGARATTLGGTTARPLWLVSLLMFVFALSSSVTAFHLDVVDLTPVYAHLEPLPSVLRSSGRFVWPLYYLAMWWAAERVIGGLSVRASIAVVGCAVLLQVIDVGPAYHARLGQLARTDRHLPSPAELWRVAPSGYRHLALYPPNFVGTRCLSRQPDAWITAARLAAVHGLTSNGGYTSRLDQQAVATYCARFQDELARGVIAADTIYLASAELPDAARAELTCSPTGGLLTCVARANEDPFAVSLTGAGP